MEAGVVYTLDEAKLRVLNRHTNPGQVADAPAVDPVSGREYAPGDRVVFCPANVPFLQETWSQAATCCCGTRAGTCTARRFPDFEAPRNPLGTQREPQRGPALDRQPVRPRVTPPRGVRPVVPLRTRLANAAIAEGLLALAGYLGYAVMNGLWDYANGTEGGDFIYQLGALVLYIALLVPCFLGAGALVVAMLAVLFGVFKADDTYTNPVPWVMAEAGSLLEWVAWRLGGAR
jgi:hypothetical protein